MISEDLETFVVASADSADKYGSLIASDGDDLEQISLATF